MGASKTNHFTNQEKQIAQIGRALAHPARIRIIELLYERNWTSNIELTRILKLTAPSVGNHLQKLKEAKIIQIDFLPNMYRISLNEEKISDLKDWTSYY